MTALAAILGVLLLVVTGVLISVLRGTPNIAKEDPTPPRRSVMHIGVGTMGDRVSLIVFRDLSIDRSVFVSRAYARGLANEIASVCDALDETAPLLYKEGEKE